MSVLYPITADPRFRLTTATAGQTVFSVPFFFQDNADIAVVKIDGNTGVETTLTEGVHYTLTGALEEAGGSVTLTTGATAGDIYLRVGRAVLDRVTSITRAGKYASEPLDNDLDRFILIAQEFYRELARAPKSAYGVTPPTLDAGANNTLAVWRNGNLEEGPAWEEAGGIPGPGLSAGGAQWQVPVKLSTTDYHTGWMNLPVEHLDYSAAAAKATPVDADTLLGFDSENDAAPKTFGLTAIMTWIRAKFAATPLALAGGGTGQSLVAPGAASLFGHSGSAASFRPESDFFMPGTIYGLTVSNNGSDLANDIDIAPGACVDSTGTVMMKLTGALTKRLDANFTVGNNQGMRETGSISNATWHIFLIMRPDTGVVDVLASLSPTAPTLPANYVYFRRIRSIRRVGGNIVREIQVGDYVALRVPETIYSASNPGNSAVAITLAVPTGLQVLADLTMTARDGSAGGDSNYLITANDQADTAASTVSQMTIHSNGTDTIGASVGVRVLSDTAAGARFRMNGSNADIGVTITAYGYTDTRGRLAA